MPNNRTPVTFVDIDDNDCPSELAEKLRRLGLIVQMTPRGMHVSLPEGARNAEKS